MITYKKLNQIHPSIDPEERADRIALYEGSSTIRRRARRFLRQRPAESDANYQARLAEFQYRNYIGAIVDNFASMIFKSKPTAVATIDGRELPNHESAYYDDFKTNADRAGTNIDAIFKAMFTDAAVTGTSWLLVKQPPDLSGLEPPVTKLDFENRGLGKLYVEKLDPGTVLDWATDTEGNLSMVVVHRIGAERARVGDDRDWITESWEVYDQKDVETFAVQYRRDKPPSLDTEIPSVDLRPHGLNRIPFICMSFDPSQHLAARLESPQVAHCVSLNAEAWAQARCAYAMPVFKLNDPGSWSNVIMGPDNSFVIQKDESVSYLEIDGGFLDALDRTINRHKDELFRIATSLALGVENNAAAVGRSALSKAADAAASRVAMAGFADKVREEMGKLYALISNVRGENHVTWSIQGLDDLDVAAFLEALKLLREASGDIHSPSAHAALESRAVEALLPDTKPETKHVWRRETLEAIKSKPTPEQREADALASVIHAGHAHDDAA